MKKLEVLEMKLVLGGVCVRSEGYTLVGAVYIHINEDGVIDAYTIVNEDAGTVSTRFPEDGPTEYIESIK